MLIFCQQILAVHLIHEASKGPASFWHPYIQQLPRHYTTWTNWGPEAVEALQLQHAQEAAAAAISKARQEWTSARSVLQQLGESGWNRATLIHILIPPYATAQRHHVSPLLCSSPSAQCTALLLVHQGLHGSRCGSCQARIGGQAPLVVLVTVKCPGANRIGMSTVQVWTRSGAAGVPGSGPHQQCCPGPCTTQQTHLVAASHPWVTCTTMHHQQHRTHQTWHTACSSCCRSRDRTSSSSSCSSCKSHNKRCRS